MGPARDAEEAARENVSWRSAGQIAEALAGEWAAAPSRAERPYVLANMVSTADGRATVEGRSGKIGNAGDRELFHALRSAVDAIVVGAGTARMERYGRIVRSATARAWRRARGLEEEPLACIVSAHLDLPPDLPLLQEPAARVVIVTSSEASLLANPAEVSYLRARREGRVDLGLALRELAERFAVRTLLCEGGPHLVGELLGLGLVDELFLSLAPKLAGGEPAQQDLRIVASGDFDPLIELRLVEAFEHESLLALRYRVLAQTGA